MARVFADAPGSVVLLVLLLCVVALLAVTKAALGPWWWQKHVRERLRADPAPPSATGARLLRARDVAVAAALVVAAGVVVHDRAFDPSFVEIYRSADAAADTLAASEGPTPPGVQDVEAALGENLDTDRLRVDWLADIGDVRRFEISTDDGVSVVCLQVTGDAGDAGDLTASRSAGRC
jgi:hypothetical protein